MKKEFQPFIYFMLTENDDAIRIGHTGAEKTDRVMTHKKYGMKLLAVVPGTAENEDKLHDYFEPHLVSGRDQSTYAFDAVYPYVQRLLDLKFASQNQADAQNMSEHPFWFWSPEEVNKPLFDGDQQLLLVTEAARADIADIWQTPEKEVELCRQALGGQIDLDPASCYEANLRVRAKSFYDEKMNGLVRPWHGAVFLNPPYGGKEKTPTASKFIDKLVTEISCGNVTKAITILNLQSVPTKWFPRLGEVTMCHAIYRSRINFIGPKAKSGKGTAFSSAKNGTIFSFFGEDWTLFADTFKPHAMILQEVKRKGTDLNGAN